MSARTVDTAVRVRRRGRRRRGGIVVASAAVVALLVVGGLWLSAVTGLRTVSGGPLQQHDGAQTYRIREPIGRPFTFWSPFLVARNGGGSTVTLDAVELEGASGVRVLGARAASVPTGWRGMPLIHGRDDWWPPRVPTRGLAGARVGPGRQAVVLIGLRTSRSPAGFDAIRILYHVGGARYAWTEDYKATWTP